MAKRVEFKAPPARTSKFWNKLQARVIALAPECTSIARLHEVCRDGDTKHDAMETVTYDEVSDMLRLTGAKLKPDEETSPLWPEAK